MLSEPTALIIPKSMLPTFSPNLTLKEAFETATQINEELERMEFNDAYFSKKSNF